MSRALCLLFCFVSCVFIIGTDAQDMDGSSANAVRPPEAPDWSNVDCASLNKYGSNMSCTFVRNAANCQLDDGFIDYFEIIYCDVPHKLVPLIVTVMFIWLAFLLIALGTTAEEFFCPSLTVISQTLKMNQNMAGVTFLAIGNGAPDIFSSFAAIKNSKQNDISLAIGALFGAGIFVSGVVVGAICIKTTFTLTSRPFLRDVIFYLSATMWVFTILWRGKLFLAEALGIIGLYVIYVIVVVLGRYIYQRGKKRQGGDIPSMSQSPKLTGKELVDGQRKRSQPDVYIRQAITASCGSESGVGMMQENGSPDNLQEERDIQSPESFEEHVDPVDPGTVSTRSSKELDTISVASDIATDLVDASGHFSSYSTGCNSPLRTRRRSRSLPPIRSPSEHEVTVTERLHQQRRKLRIKRMSFGIANALDMGETIGVALLGNYRIAHPHTSQAARRWDRERDEGIEDAEPLLSESISFKVDPLDHPFVYALKGLIPIKCEDWKGEGIIWKILDILKIPVLFLLLLTTPVVDYEEDYNKWNKWLNIWHIMIAPVFFVVATNIYHIELNGVFPVWALALVIAVVAAVVVAFTSKPYKPPVYHALFAYVGFIVSIIWIYAVANEIVNVLQTSGAVFNISSGILGLTVLAWANSIGDFVSDFTMAKQGFPRMGVSACFGGPLLNLLLGFGIGTAYRCITNASDYTMKLNSLTSVEFICAIFLMANLVFSLVLVTIVFKFRVGRFYGISLLCIYVTFVVVAVFGEIGLISSPV